MNIAFVSTFPPAPCGIGHYTSHLRHGLKPLIDDGSNIPVIAEKHVSMPETEGEVHRYWRRGRSWEKDILQGIDDLKLKPELVHIQHEEALLHQDKRFPWLLDQMRQRGIATVVTLHSVYRGPLAPPGRWNPKRFHKALSDTSQALIVHQNAGCADVLLEHGVPSKQVSVIPHGTLTFDTPTRQDAREQLNLHPTDPVVLFFGVIHPKKNIHVLLQAFDEVADAVPGAKLVVVGKPRQRNILDKSYTLWLEKQVMRTGLRKGWLDYRRGFLADELLPSYLAATDIVTFPHKQRYGSASGVLHLALTAGRAIVCSKGPKFTEAYDHFYPRFPTSFPPSNDPQAWARGLIRLLKDPDLREEMEGMASDLGRETLWSQVARQHLDVYNKAFEDFTKN
jgi:glycosyltransferase involved in cell wall biosynthesis